MFFRRAWWAVALLTAVLALGTVLPAPAAASEFFGRYWKWSPRGNAKISGTTTMSIREHYGTGLDPSDASSYTKFKASNRRTNFYFRSTEAAGYKRVSRNRFFKLVRASHTERGDHGCSAKWTWRKSSHGKRYRYIKSAYAFGFAAG